MTLLTRPRLDAALAQMGCTVRTEQARAQLSTFLRLVEADAAVLEAELRARHDEPLMGLVDRFVCGLTFTDRAALIDAMGCASARLVDQAFVDPAPDGILTTLLCRVLFEVIRFGYFGLFFPTGREHPQYPDRPWVLAFPRGARHIVPFGPVPDTG